MCFFFFKQKTAYEMRISDWSSDVCSSDLSLKALADVDWQQVEALGESALAHADRLLHSLIEHLPAAEKILWEIFDSVFGPKQQIGRASCRERVCQDV